MKPASSVKEARLRLSGYDSLSASSPEYVERPAASSPALTRIIDEAEAAAEAGHAFNWFFTGHTGAGKSTELAGLTADNNLRRHYLPWRIDIKDSYDVHDLEFNDILHALALGCLALAEEFTVKVSSKLLERLALWGSEVSEEQTVSTSTEGQAGLKLNIGIPFIMKKFATLGEEIKSGGEKRKTIRRKLSGFTFFLTGVESANAMVENLEVNYTNNATARIALVKSIREAATQAVGYVKSNKAWATQFKAVKMAADKLRNMSPPRKPEPPPALTPGGEPPAAVEKRNKGEQAYVELQAHLATLITALAACGGYAPPSLTIGLSNFNSLLSQFRGINLFICQLSAQLTTAREVRRVLYYVGDECLNKKFQAIKNSVKGQYGQNSTEYGSVKGIKW